VPARELLEGLGHKRPLLSTICWRGELELMAGDWLAVDETLIEAATLAGGESHVAADTAAFHARAALALGRIDEAERLAGLARQAASPESRPAQAMWRSVAAAVLTARGSAPAAVELASEAARLLRRTDLLSLRADVDVDLAAALHACGDSEGASAAMRQAGILYELKGNTVGARRVREAATPSATRV
jgi:ATP/maltotriose-dependent transcriptional regulator MalT